MVKAIEDMLAEERRKVAETTIARMCAAGEPLSKMALYTGLSEADVLAYLENLGLSAHN